MQGTKCKDAVWPGFECAKGLKCYRISQYYRQVYTQIALQNRCSEDEREAAVTCVKNCCNLDVLTSGALPQAV